MQVVGGYTKKLTKYPDRGHYLPNLTIDLDGYF